MSKTNMPTGEFGVIYADPPWEYDDSAVPRGGVDNHYVTMSLAEIKQLDVPSADDSILYLWCTVTHMPEALDVMQAWGFEYKTQAVWDKQDMGVGYWFRGQHELLLVGVKGDVHPPKQQHRRSSVFNEQRTEHSSKPKKVRSHIEQAHPDADKLELFSRNNRVGWEVFGDEVDDSPQHTFDTIEANQ